MKCKIEIFTDKEDLVSQNVFNVEDHGHCEVHFVPGGPVVDGIIGLWGLEVNFFTTIIKNREEYLYG